jgi:acyl carrier protein
MPVDLEIVELLARSEIAAERDATMGNDPLSQPLSAIKPIKVLHIWQEDSAVAEDEQRTSEWVPLVTLQNTGSAPKTKAEIREGLLALLSELLHLDPQELDVSQPFTYYGLDSADAIRTMGKLETWLGRSLSPTLIWDYPNIETLAHYLAGEPGAEFQSAIYAAPKAEREPIAIVGLGCRFPGAQNPEEFWRLLHAGGDAITEVPKIVGTLTLFMTRILWRRGRLTAAQAVFWSRSISSTLSFLESLPARRREWILNSDFCWKWLGKHWKTPGWRPIGWPAAQRVCLLE